MRHSTSSFQKWGERVREVWPILLPVLVTTVALIAAIPLAALWQHQPFPVVGDWLAQWQIWDAPHYLSLAEHGYQTAGDAAYSIVFYPLLPAVIWLTHWLTAGSFAVAWALVAFLASCGVAWLMYLLVKLDGGVAQARRAVWLCLLWPTAIFFHLAYTESLYLALAVGMFLLARKRHYASAIVLVALATATRTQGLVLVPALLTEILVQERWQVRKNWKLLTVAGLTSLAGFGVYLVLNLSLFGNPFHYLAVEREHWSMSLTPFWLGMLNTVHSFSRWEGSQWWLLAVAQLVAAGVGLVTVVYTILRLRASYAVYAICTFLVSTSIGFWISIPRYLLVLFPTYIMLSAWAERRWAWRLELVVCALLFGWYAYMAVTGQQVL